MLDLMPAPHLIYNEWDKHGTCSGLAPRAYFDTVREARAMVKIPPEYTDLQEPLNVTPAAVEAAFIKANPNLSTESMAIECDKKRLTGVRICLSKELQFRSCAQIAQADGRVGNDTMLAVQSFQRKVGMERADGYAGIKLLARLRQRP